MRMPRGLDHRPGLQLVIFLLVVVALPLTAVGRCNRAMQSANATATQRATAPADIIDVGAVSIGTVARGALDRDARVAWTFAGAKGQRIAVALFSAWDNSVAVVMPDSTRELTHDGFSGGNGQGRIDGVTLPVDGTYRIVVSGENGGAGNYELTVNEAPPAKPGTMTSVGAGDAPIVMTR